MSSETPPDEPEAPIAVTPPEQLAPVTPAQLQRVRQQEGSSAAADQFPVVALGGSAGSLAAFEEFFMAMPANSGMAFVVVSHLVPDQASQLASVLQHFTQMPVVEVTDGLRVRPDRVYVIPPNHDMSLLHGTLLLFEPAQPHGRRLPIDFFLQSLAKDARERAVAIVCSGLGTDGTLGLKLVMENFGMVMVQAPDTADFDSMPRSAIATEFVDHILPAGQLPARLLDYVKRPRHQPLRRDEAPADANPVHALQKIFSLIRARTGHDFSFYKRNTVFRRIERRMSSHQIKEFTQYVRYLQETPEEVDALFKELLIGVTKFFRDQEAFAHLKTLVLPLVQAKPADSTFRVWAPGCSTGEEAYSLAMLLLECREATGRNRDLNIQIFATDLNAEGVEVARSGVYSENIAADVSPERRARFFAKIDGLYYIRKEVRDRVVFAVHNLNKDAPFTRLDLLVCRNLLIYLSSELQRNLLPVFHYALSPGGLLFLGPSENLTGFQELFQALDGKWKISRRLETKTPLTRLFASSPVPTPHQNAHPLPPAGPMHPTAPRKDTLFAAAVHKVLLREFSPPAVVINPKGEILFVNGRTGRYLEPAPGVGGLNLFTMTRDELSFSVTGAVYQAATTREAVVVDNVRLSTEAGVQLLRLAVKPLNEPAALEGLLLVTFEEQPTSRRVRQGKAGPGAAHLERDAVVTALEKELQFTKQHLQNTKEEMDSSVEELKSTNEELQSANEELQSTNEEAMTTREEMQSLNEELMTMNTQYLSKTEELSQAANDMKNLLDATEIATLFLGHDLAIKRFTPSIGRVLTLLPTDVGRPFAHFAPQLRVETLLADVQQVLDRLVMVESNIQTGRGEWFTMRILPYRTLDNYISGVVMTFADITALKAVEARLQATTTLAESIVETVREPLMVLNGRLQVLLVSQAFTTMFGLAPEQAKGQLLQDLDGGAWNQPGLRQHLREVLESPTRPFNDFEYEATFPSAGRRRLRLYGRCIISGGTELAQVLLGIEEV